MKKRVQKYLLVIILLGSFAIGNDLSKDLAASSPVTDAIVCGVVLIPLVLSLLAVVWLSYYSSPK